MLSVTFDQPDFTFLIQELSTNSVPKVFRAFSSYRRSAISQQFGKEVDPYGVPQTPLSAAYEVVKRKRWGDKSILVASGKMKGSWASEVNGLTYKEEFSDPKAIYHQTGSRNLPKRPMLPTQDRGLPPKDEQKLQALVSEELQRSWRRFGKPPTLQEIAQVTAGDVESVLGEIAAYANK